MKFLIFGFILLTSFSFSIALNNSDSNADEKFKLGSYEEAIPLYLDLLSNNSDNALNNYRLGLCFLFTKKEDKALRYLNAVSTLESPEDALHYYFHLGRALHLNQQFELAIVSYNQYEEAYKKGKETFSQIIEEETVLPSIYGNGYDLVSNTITVENALEKLIASCEYGIKLSAHPRKVAVEGIGSGINSENDEYAPVINGEGDELYYTSKVKVEDGLYAERVFYSKMTAVNKWSKPVEIQISDDPETDLAPLYLSSDNDFLLIYNSNSNNGDIYSIQKQGDKWLEPENFTKQINSKYWEPSAAMFPDKKSMIFSSNRPDGYGGLDLYITRLGEKGRWTEPQNLGPNVNTEFDDDAPFILVDGKTMYFSSRGHLGVGGYDVFKTVFENNEWTVPENMEIPINSPYDDIYLTWTSDERRAYFASHRKGTVGKSDIYYMDFSQISLTVFLTQKTADGIEPVHDYIVTLQHMQSGKMIDELEKDPERGLSTFLAKENEMYLLKAKAPGLAPYVESMSLRRGGDLVANQNKVIKLIPEEELVKLFDDSNLAEIEKSVVNVNHNKVSNKNQETSGSTKKISYNNDVYRQGDILKPKVHFILNVSKLITEYSKGQMDKVIEIMNENPNLKIQIVAHSDLSGDSKYNDQLSKERAITVKQYFIAKGISEDRLLGAWKGDKDPIIETRNPELLNRRVEFVIAQL